MKECNICKLRYGSVEQDGKPIDPGAPCPATTVHFDANLRVAEFYSRDRLRWATFAAAHGRTDNWITVALEEGKK